MGSVHFPRRRCATASASRFVGNGPAMTRYPDLPPREVKADVVTLTFSPLENKAAWASALALPFQEEI